MKFGKQIQRKQLEIPEYAANFVDYKALKKLIKELKNSPITRPQTTHDPVSTASGVQAILQANRGSFFFRLDRELDKVNSFYTVKESESQVRLQVLRDKQRSLRLRYPVTSRNSTQFITLEQGFRDIIKELSKLQQFVEINAIAFSKILKKWDKSSKSQTKEQYLSRAVEIQPVFNRAVISDLSDKASESLLDCAAWVEGEGTTYTSDVNDAIQPTPRLEQTEADSDLLDILYRGDLSSLKDILDHLDSSTASQSRISRAFLTVISQAPEAGLDLLLATNLVDWKLQDEINDRNCLHKVAMVGRRKYLRIALDNGIEASTLDAYGRIPLHYAAMNGHTRCIEDLVDAQRDTVDLQDLDHFTPLIHAIVHSRLESLRAILNFSPQIDRIHQTGHVPLNLACQHGSIDMVKLLLSRKPQIVPDAEGLYPQHVVARFGTDSRILLLLQKNGADLDQEDELYSWTPLFHAASEGREDCLKTLLSCGVKLDARDEKGQPALYYATWEGHLNCMALLSNSVHEIRSAVQETTSSRAEPMPDQSIPSGPSIDQIPDLSLPPPIMPTRRYGHNFLENKSTVLMHFNDDNTDAVIFYDESKYPAARLTVTPSYSDSLPRNLLLPIQDDNRLVSFETEDLERFAVEFDVYPTFGKRVLAKGSVPPEVFSARRHSSGSHHLSLIDPRLRTVGQLNFKFQVIKHFPALPAGNTFATYWKATGQLESHSSLFVSGSSLSGEYLRVVIQSTEDAVPVAWPEWALECGGIHVPISRLSLETFEDLRPVGVPQKPSRDVVDALVGNVTVTGLRATLYRSHLSLSKLLECLPAKVKIELHILYPTEEQEHRLHLGSSTNINTFVDSLLHTVFDSAQNLRDSSPPADRSLVFSSYNADLCTAINWKQPHYPVLLCNDLTLPAPSTALSPSKYEKSDQISTTATNTNPSIKEAVRIASSNNFMGIMCKADLLVKVPALVQAIKEAGLVLISDASSTSNAQMRATLQTITTEQPHTTSSSVQGVGGTLGSDGSLCFQEAVET